jgi:hypothetical protein
VPEGGAAPGASCRATAATTIPRARGPEEALSTAAQAGPSIGGPGDPSGKRAYVVRQRFSPAVEHR